MEKPKDLNWETQMEKQMVMQTEMLMDSSTGILMRLETVMEILTVKLTDSEKVIMTVTHSDSHLLMETTTAKQMEK